MVYRGGIKLNQKRKSTLFPNRQRPKNNGLENIADFTEELASEIEVKDSIDEAINHVEEENINNKKVSKSPYKTLSKENTVKYPNKSHKGKAGRKAEYDDPRLKKEYNAKISLSTKVRIERLISRKFDGKSMGDIIDIALDNLVLNFDRDDRDSLFKSYKEDMELLKPVIEEKNKKLKQNGKSYLEITDEINESTLQIQKELWVDRKI